MPKLRLAVLAAAVVALSLTGCAVENVAAPAPTPSLTDEVPAATATPSPTTQPDLTAIRLSATELTLLDERGAPEARLAFRADDPASFVDAVSAAVGADATEATTPGGFEGAEFTTEYEWDGLRLSTAFSQECLPDCRGTVVVITGDEVNGIPVSTASGISVGNTVAEAQALGAQTTPNGTLAAEPEDPALINSTTEPTRIVVLDVDDDSAEIVSILASGWFVSFGGI